MIDPPDKQAAAVITALLTRDQRLPRLRSPQQTMIDHDGPPSALGQSVYL